MTRGVVDSFQLAAGWGNWSSNARLILKYTSDAQGDLPKKLFLKMVNTDLGDGETFGDSEVTYYIRDYLDVPRAPLLNCYDAAYSATLGRYHLLLADVTQTHTTAAEREPTLAFGLALADGLATLHARWWGEKRLVEAGAPIHNAVFIRHFVDIAEPGVGHILGRFSNELAPHWPDLLLSLFARHPGSIIARARDLNGFTLIHGDVGEQNVLVPRHGTRPIFIIDRQPFSWSLTTWFGVYDLVYALVLDWEIEARRQFEMPILKHYHAQLLANGLHQYSWDQLLFDYRLCVPMAVYIATEYCRGGISDRWIKYIMPMLIRSLTACDDLDCQAMW